MVHAHRAWACPKVGPVAWGGAALLGPAVRGRSPIHPPFPQLTVLVVLLVTAGRPMDVDGVCNG